MSGPTGTPPDTLAGIALLVAAVACFAVLDTTTKWTTASVPLLMALWFRYAFQAVVTTATMLPIRGRALLRTAHPRFQCLRGALQPKFPGHMQPNLTHAIVPRAMPPASG